MTERTLFIETLPPAAMLSLRLWTAAPDVFARVGDGLGVAPPPVNRAFDLAGGWRILGVEPNVWRLIGPLAGRFDRLAAIGGLVDEDGAVTDMTGAFVRLRVSGRRWRSLLMVGGVFDAEDRSFGLGAVAGTLLHHVTVLHEVLGEDAVAIHVAPSYAPHLLDHLHAAAAMLEAIEANA